MTKYILHGGYSSSPSIHNENFYKEMVKGLSEPVKILTAYFAVPKEKWEELLEDDKKKFFKFNPGTQMEFTIASDNIDTLINQIKSADIVYIRGGREPLVFEIFKKIDNLEELFKDKVAAGSSAGAYVFSKYFYSNDKDCIRQGTGILPIKTYCHYTEEKAANLQKLKEYKEDLEVHIIPDTEFIVIEK